MAGGVSMMTHAFDIGFGRGVVLGAILFAFGRCAFSRCARLSGRTLRNAVLAHYTGVGAIAALEIRRFAVAMQLMSSLQALSARQWELIHRGLT